MARGKKNLFDKLNFCYNFLKVFFLKKMGFFEKLKKAKKEEFEENILETKEKEQKELLQLSVDVLQTPEEIILFAQIPGADPQNVEIFLQENNEVLVLEGEIFLPKEIEKDLKNYQLVLKECNWGRFYRKIILPSQVDAERVQAKLKKGVLMVKLPLLKPQVFAKKKIEIKGE